MVRSLLPLTTSRMHTQGTLYLLAFAGCPGRFCSCHRGYTPSRNTADPPQRHKAIGLKHPEARGLGIPTETGNAVFSSPLQLPAPFTIQDIHLTNLELDAVGTCWAGRSQNVGNWKVETGSSHSFACLPDLKVCFLKHFWHKRA